jgi:predicted transcriptional regulator
MAEKNITPSAEKILSQFMIDNQVVAMKISRKISQKYHTSASSVQAVLSRLVPPLSPR